MKKLLCMLCLLLALVCVFASCDNNENTEQNGGDQSTTHTHAFDEWSVSKAATCSAKGEEKRTCACGESETREIAATGHTRGKWVITKEPTGRVEGVQECRCTVAGCNKLLEIKGVPCKVDNIVDAAVPDELNYEGEVINLMYWQDVENPEFEQAEITGDNVRDAIYHRNVNVESRLNVELNFIPVEVSYNVPVGSFLKHISAITEAGTKDYDIIATHSRTQGSLAVQGYLYNIASIQDSYIDLEKPWWPAQLVENVSFGDGDYYFVSGDMSTNTLYMMHAMFLNKNMFEELEIELPYDTVREGKWTVDKLIEITSGVYKDLDGDRMVSTGDRFGFTALHYVADSFFAAANLRYIESDPTDTLILSPDYSSRKAASLIGKLSEWVIAENVWLTSYATHNLDERDATRQLFAQKQALIWMDHLCVGYHFVRTVSDLDYGIVPNPKYDENQRNYYTGMGYSYSLYGIFCDFDDRGDKEATLQMFTAVLECYASEAYRLTTPEIFEETMQQKYSIGQDDTDMFEIVRAGVVFDLGKIFGQEELSLMSENPSKAIAAGADWEYLYPSYTQRIEEELELLVDNYERYKDRDQ